MKVQKHIQILYKTMQEMPDTFTSSDFTQMAYKNGHPHLEPNTGFHEFVKKYARNVGRWSKTWTKKIPRVQPKIEPQIDIVTDKSDIQPIKKYPTSEDMIAHLKSEGYYGYQGIGEMIQYLKSKGYKVMKHIEKWEEC